MSKISILFLIECSLSFIPGQPPWCQYITARLNSLSLDLALEVAEYFRLKNDKANIIIKQIKKAVASWKNIAEKYKIPRAEQDRMAKAFTI